MIRKQNVVKIVVLYILLLANNKKLHAMLWCLYEKKVFFQGWWKEWWLTLPLNSMFACQADMTFIRLQENKQRSSIVKEYLKFYGGLF